MSLPLKIISDQFRLLRLDHLDKLLFRDILQRGAAPIGGKKLLRGFLANSRNLSKLGCEFALRASAAVEGYGEAMGFIPDSLDQVQDWRVAVKDDRLLLSPLKVKDFLLLRDAGKRLVDDLEFLECCGSGMQLSETAIHKDQIRHWSVFFAQPPVASSHHLLHAGEVVVLRHGSDDELPIVRLLHAPVFPDHHGGDNISPLSV